VARTARREIGYERLVSSAPLPALARMTGIEHDRAAFSSNKVLIFNLGFDRKGQAGVHWVYYPDRARSFYRIGHYDNIFESDRMSLYVEIGLPSHATVDVEATLPRVLDDLRAVGVVDDHRLLSWHSVVMDPAYVHITRRSLAETARLRRILQANGVYSIGRYGGWTYCSIEDNIVEARALMADLDAV
jgi:protoporphyrinogen oxidase